MHHKAKVEIDMKNHSMEGEVAFLHPLQKMRKEMDLAWKDFFEKNPGRKEDVWRWVEERLRSKQILKDGARGVCGSISTRENAALVISSLLEKGFNTNGSTEAYALRRREKIAPLILKRRIWWEPVLGASSYVVYLSKERTIFEPDNFSWETTPGIISKLVRGKTKLIIPDEWPEFPTESGTYYIGITSKDDIGNQSDPFLLSGLFKFLAPSAPLRGGIENL
jgi:hypothetical protein